MTKQEKISQTLRKEMDDSVIILEASRAGDHRAKKAALQIREINSFIGELNQAVKNNELPLGEVAQKIDELEKERHMIIDEFDVEKARAKIFLNKTLKRRKEKPY